MQIRTGMRKIILLSMITLDGVLQAPGSPEEDPSGGFGYGGWVAPYDDEIYGAEVQKELAPAAYLLGRKTYEIWAGYWPDHGEFWPGINAGEKYVFSKKLKDADPLVAGWQNSSVIHDLAGLRRLKESGGADLQVWGSGELAQLLLKYDLVDELRLKIHPLTLGAGKKLFNGGAIPAAFALTECTVTTTGVIMANYTRAGKVQTGTIGS